MLRVDSQQNMHPDIGAGTGSILRHCTIELVFRNHIATVCNFNVVRAPVFQRCLCQGPPLLFIS